MSFSNPEQWYQAAAARPAGVSDDVIEKRLKLAELMRKGSIDAGRVPTEEMIADEMLLITGRMDRDEFNAYLRFKKANGGWQ